MKKHTNSIYIMPLRIYFCIKSYLQEITDDASTVERKWFDDSQPFIETRKTPDLENMDVEQYQQSIAQ